MKEKPSFHFDIQQSELKSILSRVVRNGKPFIISGRGIQEVTDHLRMHRPVVVVSDFDGTLTMKNSFLRFWKEFPADLQRIYEEVLKLYVSDLPSKPEKTVLESGMICLLAAVMGAEGWDEEKIKEIGKTAELREDVKEFFDLFRVENRCIVSLSLADYIRAAMLKHEIDVPHVLANELMYRPDWMHPLSGRKRFVFTCKPEMIVASETKWTMVQKRLPEEVKRQPMLCIGDDPIVDQTLWMQKRDSFNVLVQPASNQFGMETDRVIELWRLHIIVSDLPTLVDFLGENSVGC